MRFLGLWSAGSLLSASSSSRWGCMVRMVRSSSRSVVFNTRPSMTMMVVIGSQSFGSMAIGVQRQGWPKVIQNQKRRTSPLSLLLESHRQSHSDGNDGSNNTVQQKQEEETQQSRSVSEREEDDSSSHDPYVPPKVWTNGDENGNKGNPFGSINQPTAGARYDKELPQGEHPLQLYSLGTPNGQKVTILLEELLAAGIQEAEYDAWLVDIMESDQFGSGFVAVNPNSKIPALLDYDAANDSDDDDSNEPQRVFESGSILVYLADKFAGRHSFLPPQQRVEVMNWLFWQMGSAPFVGGGFGHFYVYAKKKQQYPIDRFTMETKRQLDVLNNQLQDKTFICGDTYTIADMAIFPWYGALVLGDLYGPNAREFLNVAQDYPHVIRWAETVQGRAAVQRGRCINKYWGNDDEAQLRERHSAADVDQALAKSALVDDEKV